MSKSVRGEKQRCCTGASAAIISFKAGPVFWPILAFSLSGTQQQLLLYFVESYYKVKNIFEIMIKSKNKKNNKEAEGKKPIL